MPPEKLDAARGRDREFSPGYVGLRAQWAPSYAVCRLGPEAALPTFELSVSFRRLPLNRRPGDQQQLQKLGLGMLATLSWMTRCDSIRDQD